MKFKHILVPVDFSPTALKAVDHAASIAKAFESKITLMHVKESYGHEMLILEANKDYFLNEEYDVIARNNLQKIADDVYERYGLKANLVLTAGRVSGEVSQIVDDEKVDVVVMGTHGTKGLEELLLGSNAFKVVSKVNVPVLTVRQSAENTNYGTIVMPMDNTFHSREKVAFVETIASAYQSEIIIPVFEWGLSDQQSSILKARIKQVEDYLKQNGHQCTVEFYSTGRSGDMTIDIAKNRNANLIVIMTDQEDSGFFSSSAAQKVVNHSPIPVLSITPSSLTIPDHISPYYTKSGGAFSNF
jgi:nucleotide-binding universal stress UspA family protein